MLDMTRAKTSHRGRSSRWANPPLESPDNPVKRYLGNRSFGPGSWARRSRSAPRRNQLRLAF